MAEKLALIDKDLLLRLLGRVNPQPPINPNLRELSRVENKLSDTLAQDPSPSQANVIGNLISKHNFHKSEFEKPNFDNSPQPPVTTQVTQSVGESDNWVGKTIDAAPTRYQRTAKSLLDHIRKSDSLGWNDRGELIRDGRIIENTNILDLVHSLVRPRPTLIPPPGSAEFLEALRSTNTPQELMLNAPNIITRLSKQKKSSDDLGDLLSSPTKPSRPKRKRTQSGAKSPTGASFFTPKGKLPGWKTLRTTASNY